MKLFDEFDFIELGDRVQRHFAIGRLEVLIRKLSRSIVTVNVKEGIL